mgnify:CR=1 FL=1|tara:strand:+ start:435 stop:1916 length:1482 start_codon:yes stop_codon:yes gene_type:complete
MGFDWKAFGAAFLDKQTEGIRKRRADAEEYEEEQEELARENKKLIANRTLLAADASQMAQKAMELGATKEQVMAAMGSGALGIKTFYEKLLAAANQKGMQTLGPADVEAIIDMPEVFEVNPAFVDMSLNEMAEIQYGVKPRPGTETEDVQTSDSVLASMFGLNAMSQAKKKLQDTKYIGGMSIADVNELAAQADYDSLFPNLGVNFFDKEFYGPASASEFVKTLTDIQMDAVSGKAAEDFIKAAGNTHLRKITEGNEDYDAEYAARNKGVTPMDKEQDAREYLIQIQARSVIQGTIDNFGQTGLFDHQPSVDLIEKIMGEQFVKDQLELLKSFNGVDEDDTQLTDRELTQEGEELFAAKERIREADKQFKPQEDPETQTSDTETQETTVSTEEDDDEFVPIPRPESKGTIKDALDAGGVKAWDRKYEGKLDPITGEKIMVDPRPPAGGPKDKEVEAVTRTGVRLPNKTRKVTAREEWDILYGETHNPDGSPKL